MFYLNPRINFNKEELIPDTKNSTVPALTYLILFINCNVASQIRSRNSFDKPTEGATSTTFDDDVAPNNHVHISEQYYHIHPQ